jgi:hypothetical protein
VGAGMGAVANGARRADARQLTTAVLTMAFIATAPGGAKAAGETTRNVAELECKAVMRLGDEDRTATIAFLHGYIAGTDKLMDDCLDHPKDKALEVLMKYAQ